MKPRQFLRHTNLTHDMALQLLLSFNKLAWQRNFKAILSISKQPRVRMLNSWYTLSIWCILTCWNHHMTHCIVCTPSPLILGHLMRPYPRELLKQRHWIAFFIALIIYFHCQIQNFKTLLSRPYSKTSSYLHSTIVSCPFTYVFPHIK